jgi:uncharacterized protein (DUF1501 family)
VKKSSPDLSRREFIGQASCAGVGATALFSTLLSLRLANSLAAQSAPPTSDYKALVCLFLSGGNDSYNMLIPTTPGEYAAYSTLRGSLALPADSLLQITPGNMGGRTLGIHPSMTEVRDLFNAGNLSFISNVGSLVRPTTLADYKAGRNRPLSLYSHEDQVKQWQTCMPDKRTAIGWGGRAADILQSLNRDSLVSMNISLAGQNAFLTGQQAFTYSVGSGGATSLTGYNPTSVNNLTAVRSAAVDSMLVADYRSLFEKSYAGATLDAVETYYEFTSAITPNILTTPVPANNSLASSLAMIARVAGANPKLGTKRQVFFVQVGGWDHHDGLVTKQQTMLASVSKALGFFWTALGELGLRNNVTLFTASDFARTLTSNGDGSDHAWGGNQMAMGGAVAGGYVHGNKAQGYYPDMQNIATIDTGQGRLIPGVAVDEYARDLLSWFGVTNGDMDYVLPAYSSRFGGREPLGIIGTPYTAPASSSSSSSGSGGGGGGGGGAMSGLATGAAGAALLLKMLADRKARIKAEEARAG